jgi:Mismatch repair ATPase (MutS family)
VLNRASSKLEQIRHDLAETRQRILQTLQHIMHNHSQALQENHITQREHCFVLAVKANFKERIGGIVRDSSNSGLTLFIEPQAVVPLHEKLRQLQKQETSEIERILRQLSDKVTAVVSDLQKLITAVTQIDLANAKAQYGRWLGASPPEFDKEAVYLQELRHPLLVWQERHEQGRAVVPLRVAMSGQIRSVIITGPNTGGKTATLKTIGLVALMAKAGMLIPADSPAQIPYFDAVYADMAMSSPSSKACPLFRGISDEFSAF